MSKYLIVGHNDADGNLGIAIIHQKLSDTVKDCQIDVVNDDLAGRIDWSKYSGYKGVFIVDHPYVPELEKAGRFVVWLDHHTGSFKSDRPDIEGIRSASMSGCELAWLYCYGSEEDCNYVIGYPKDSRMDAKIKVIRAKAPEVVQQVGDKDNWDRVIAGPEAASVFVGLNAYPLFTQNPQIWKDVIRTPRSVDYDFGKNILQYLDWENARAMADVIPCYFKGYPEYKVALLNTRSHGSGIFKSIAKDFDYGAVFCVKDDRRCQINFYDLHSTEKLDLGALATKHGGGGHKGAAGCTVANYTEVFNFNV